MTNRDKYWEEMIKADREGELNVFCKEHIPEFKDAVTVLLSTVMVADWLNAEYKEPEADMNDYIGKMVYVSNNKEAWFERELAFITDIEDIENKFFCRVEEDRSDVLNWKFCRPIKED